MSETLVWDAEPRLVMLQSPEGSVVLVSVLTPHPRPAPELCVLAVLEAERRDGYPREALVG